MGRKKGSKNKNKQAKASYKTTGSKTSWWPNHSKGAKYMGAYQGGYGYTSGTTYKSCHHEGRERVFVIDGRHVYGAGSGIRFVPTTNLVIDLANSYNNGAKPPKSAASFIGHATDDAIKALFPPPPVPPKPRRLDLNWPDMQAPDIDTINVDFWRTVWGIMPVAPDGTPANEAPHTIVCCVGGHGRTGTCLAALLICNAGFSMPNAVNFVRYHHCQKAVESSSQLIYLRELSVQAGTNTQPLDLAMVEKVEALVGAEAKEPSGTKAGKTTIWTPQNSSPELGVINQPKTEAEIEAAKLAVNGQIHTFDPTMLARAKQFCVQGPGGLVWVSRQAYEAGTYGANAEVLGVRFV